MPTNVLKTFIFIWLMTLFTIVTIVTFSFFYVEKKTEISLSSFGLARLHRIQNNGLIVIGSSLVQCAFPYDGVMDKFSKERKVELQFIRFAVPDAEALQLAPLLQPILRAKPKWVFIQIGPFIQTHSLIEWIQILSKNTHQMMNALINYQPPMPPLLNALQETDKPLVLNQTTNQIHYMGSLNFSNDPTLPLIYQHFLSEAKKQHIQVIFLQLTRAKETENTRDKRSINAENDATQRFIKKYHVPLWVSPSLPLTAYQDGNHLNTQGRIIFTEWFLQRLKNVSFKP